MKKIARATITVVAFLALFVAVGKLFKYILYDDTSSYTRITFHEMYEQDNIDILFVGTSHCYRSCVPEVFDSYLGVNTFNAGTSLQTMDGSYMVIKEAIKHNEIKQIYLEVFFEVAYDVIEDREQMTSTYIISDYMRPSFDKVKYLLNASNKDHYVNTFVTARRSWKKIYDWEYIRRLITKKLTSTYKNYEYDYVTGDTEWYSHKGYVANNIIVHDWDFFATLEWEPINISAISQDWINSLNDIIQLCKKNNVELTLFSAPFPDTLPLALGNYDEYVEYIYEIAGKNDIKYYDFNLCKPEYYREYSEDYKDLDHLNCYGAERFSELFAKLINGDISEEDLFFESFDEKIQHTDKLVYGITYNTHVNENREKIRECTIVSNLDNSFLVKVEVKTLDEKCYIIRDYSSSTDFELPVNIKGTCIVSYKSHENGVVKQQSFTIP